MKSQILTVCLGLMSLGMQAQSISLSGEWNVTLGESTSSLAKGYHATSGEARCALLPGTIDTNRLGVPPTDLTETTHLTRISG